MSRNKTQEELRRHRTESLRHLSDYLDELIQADDLKCHSKADKLCYWLSDWVTFLKFEQDFTPKSLRRYKRGEIIKVHLGFNVGSEEGGLHYAIVLDKNNSKSSPVVTVVPLTSVKPSTDLSKLRKGNVFLGNELFTNLSSKSSEMQRHLEQEIASARETINKHDNDIPNEVKEEILSKIDFLTKEAALLNRVRSEIQKMKQGSIAITGQITTISKIRIYDPKTDHDVLSGIKLSNEKLDLIDASIKANFTK